MNCICCMDNFDHFTHLSGLLCKKLSEFGLNSNTVIFEHKGSPKQSAISLDFDNCIIITDSASGIINARAERSVLIMPYEAAQKDPCGMKNISLITLGMGSRSTFCCSSISSDQTMICLQRSIKNFSDEVIEPAEFCIKAPPEQSQYTSMALLAVQMLMTRTADSISPNIAMNNIGAMFTK